MSFRRRWDEQDVRNPPTQKNPHDRSRVGASECARTKFTQGAYEDRNEDRRGISSNVRSDEKQHSMKTRQEAHLNTRNKRRKEEVCRRKRRARAACCRAVRAREEGEVEITREGGNQCRREITFSNQKEKYIDPPPPTAGWGFSGGE